MSDRTDLDSCDTDPYGAYGGTTTLGELLALLNDDARRVLELSLGEALRLGHGWLGVECILAGLTRFPEELLNEYLRRIRLDPGVVRAALRNLVPVHNRSWRRGKDVADVGAEAFPSLRELNPSRLRSLWGTNAMPQAHVTPRTMLVLQRAAKLAGEARVGADHLLLAVLEHPASPAVSLLLEVVGKDPQTAHRALLDWVRDTQRAPGQDLLEGSVLEGLGRDLVDEARQGRAQPVFGRRAEQVMLQVCSVLLQPQGGYPLLIGDPGVGKTAMVEGIACRIAVGDRSSIAPQLADRNIVELVPSVLEACTSGARHLEQQLQRILKEVRSSRGRTVLFLDEIHTILREKGEGSLGTIAAVLGPAIADGELPCIATTTVSGYRKYIEVDRSLSRVFVPIWLGEPPPEEVFDVAAAVSTQRLTPRNRVRYPIEVVDEAVRLAARYFHDRYQPGKAIDLLDRAGRQARLDAQAAGAGTPDAFEHMVSIETLRAIVSELTGVPLERLEENAGQRVLQLAEHLRRRVIGQDAAIEQIASALKRAHAGLTAAGRPLGVFLIAGPTGVGQSELGTALAEALLDDARAFLEIDMSQYGEQHLVQQLVGAPPGALGYHADGKLTGWLRRRPYSVVLLSSLEKAHPDVQRVLVQLFSQGRISDARGNHADGRNAVFVLAVAAAGPGVPSPDRGRADGDAVREAVGRVVTPELLGCVDEVVRFTALDDPTLATIIDQQLDEVARRLYQRHAITLEASGDYRRELCLELSEKSRDTQEIRRAVVKAVDALLTDSLLSGRLERGAVVGLPGKGSIHVAPPAPAPAPVEVEARRAPAERPAGRDTAPASRPPPEYVPPAPPRQEPAAQPVVERKAGEPVGRVTVSRIPLPTKDPDEIRNLQVLGSLLEALGTELERHGIGVFITDRAQEILGGPLWVARRQGLDTAAAFFRLVREPLLRRVAAGEFQQGDVIEVFWNTARSARGPELDFRRAVS
jgi:ATP-dependent Clp protease ATP-binding subunit ClpC